MDKATFDAIVNLMDDELREAVHRDIAPCTDDEFLEEYRKRHIEMFGEDFAPLAEGGQW